MMLVWILFTAAAVATLLVGEYRHNALAKAVAKPLASAGFIALAITAGALGTAYGRAVLAALLLSWLGDVFLLSPKSKPFLAGLAAFLLAHVAYAVAFVVHGQDPRASAVALGLLALPAAVVGRWLWPHLSAGFRPPVVAYVAVISVMLALACSAVAAGGHPALAVGAAAFYLSDLAVARDRFLAPGFVNRVWGLPLYYFAQLCLAWSVQAG